MNRARAIWGFGLVFSIAAITWWLRAASTNREPVVAAQPESCVDARCVVGYFASWKAQKSGECPAFPASRIPAAKLTHLNYAFATIKPDLSLDFDAATHDANLRQIAMLKKRNPHLRVLISIGGWLGSAHFSDVAATPDSRLAFVAMCIETFLSKSRWPGVFDGIDIDWEYPANGGAPGNKHRPEDTQNFTALLAEFRHQLNALGGRHRLLTIAAPAGADHYRDIELEKIHPYLDWINLMAYDFHGPSQGETQTNFHAPLWAAPNGPADLSHNADSAVRAYVQAGVPPSRIVLGVPFYGRGYRNVENANNGLYQKFDGALSGSCGDTIEYSQIKADFHPPQYQFFRDEKARAPFVYNPQTRHWISFDDAQSLREKADYIRKNKLGGAMIWELSGDDMQGSLLKAVSQNPAKRELLSTQ